MQIEDINKLVDRSKYGHMEIKDVNRDLIYWLESIAAENNCALERKEWKSKYNPYVVYEYEPFTTEEFELNYLFSSADYSFLAFVKYLYDNKVNCLEYLNNCLRN